MIYYKAKINTLLKIPSKEEFILGYYKYIIVNYPNNWFSLHIITKLVY